MGRVRYNDEHASSRVSGIAASRCTASRIRASG
jgi:hypothetical protein